MIRKVILTPFQSSVKIERFKWYLAPLEQQFFLLWLWPTLGYSDITKWLLGILKIGFTSEFI